MAPHTKNIMITRKRTSVAAPPMTIHFGIQGSMGQSPIWLLPNKREKKFKITMRFP